MQNLACHPFIIITLHVFYGCCFGGKCLSRITHCHTPHTSFVCDYISTTTHNISNEVVLFETVIMSQDSASQCILDTLPIRPYTPNGSVDSGSLWHRWNSSWNWLFTSFSSSYGNQKFANCNVTSIIHRCTFHQSLAYLEDTARLWLTN